MRLTPGVVGRSTNGAKATAFPPGAVRRAKYKPLCHAPGRTISLCRSPRPRRHCCGGPHGRPTLLQPRSAPARMNCSSNRLRRVRTISRAGRPGAYDVAANVAVRAGGDHLPAGAAAPAETTAAGAPTQPVASTHFPGTRSTLTEGRVRVSVTTGEAAAGAATPRAVEAAAAQAPQRGRRTEAAPEPEVAEPSG